MKPATSPEAAAEDSMPDLYELLGIERGADQPAIEAAYRKKCLGCHPDRMHGKSEEEKELAEEQFELLTLAQTVLTNEGTRRLYDTQGLIEIGSHESGMAVEPEELTKEQTDEWLAKYRGSEEEVDEVCMWFENSGGDFNVIINSIPGTTVKEDEARLKAIVERMFAENELTPTPLWKKTSSEAAHKKRLAQEEAVEKEHAEAMATGKVRRGVLENDLEDIVGSVTASLLSPETLLELAKKSNLETSEELLAAFAESGKRGVKRPRPDGDDGDEEDDEDDDEDEEDEEEEEVKPPPRKQQKKGKGLRDLLKKAKKKQGKRA